MKTVYYAPCVDPALYGDDFMLYKEPDSLYKDLLKDKNYQNNYNNYMDCPGFLKSIQNTFIVRSSWTSTILVNLQNGSFTNSHGEADAISEHFTAKPVSRKNLLFNVYHNFLFFCEDDLEITTMPAYMHNSEFQRKCTYIPGSFNISRWFRPIEGAFEMQEPFESLIVKTDDPLYYVKFDTSDTVKLVRFNLTPKIWAMSQGCVHHKKYQPMRSLKYLYNLFSTTLMRTLVLSHIKKNIIA